jgi:hypothetical protein
VTVVEIDDPTTANETIEVLDQDVMQLGSPQLRARRVIVRLEGSEVVFHSTNLRVRARTMAHGGLVAYVAFGPRARGSVNGGSPYGPNPWWVAEPGTEAVFVVEAGYESVALLVQPDEIQAHLRGRQREEPFRMPLGVETLHRNVAVVGKLFAWGKGLENPSTQARRVAAVSREVGR